MQSSEFHLETICSICLEAEIKYRCPACTLGTCSLTCSRRHKVRSSCSGLKDLNTFQSKATLKQSINTLASDYKFLEDVQRQLNNESQASTRNNKDNAIHNLEDNGKNQESNDVLQARDPHLAHIIAQQGITVMSAPEGLSRARQNQTKRSEKYVKATP